MIPTCANRITGKLILSGTVSEEDAAIYAYGIECLILKTIHYISYLVIAFLMRLPLELCIFAAALIPLRRNAGGFHAETRSGCYIFSCSVVFLALLCYQITLPSHALWTVLGLANIIMLRFAPLSNENKLLEKEEDLHFRKKAMIILLSLDACCLILWILNIEWVWKLAVLGIGTAAFLLGLGVVREAGVRRKIK